ncbi:Unsaturated glucuronyl hydrolase [Streptomyces xanthophaeus]|uniref:sugar ABC transporter permease n=1 Tax=Streptomyces xanthophaeus TaxID=67385 RepID=UPI00233F797E|nr:sugar ABC transporter permease [Streptomyces xanthophaeus]WCD85084.1 Unsaturated glucuronyl hydrolase [Streptomyces xanthophaeus]
MTAPEGAERALAAVLGRVAVTAAEVGPRFPLFADPGTGRWTTTGRGSWAGGFWAGLLHLRARHTGDVADRAAAVRCTARLAPWADADTATRGLILWYGTAAAPDDGAAGELRGRAARSCLAALDPELGLVPWGSALGGPRLLARADAVPGMVPLLAGAEPDGAAAASHLHRHLDLCLGADGLRPAWSFDAQAGWRPCTEPTAGWSRGRAWLLLAVADALHRSGGGPHWRPDRLEAALRRLLPHGPGGFHGPLVPPADEDRPGGPCDTSAAAVTAVALLKLARLPGPRQAAYTDRAGEILARLTGAHLSAPGGGRPAGMLLDGCYDAAGGSTVRHELVWGDFFLALALASVTGLVDITRV